MDLVLFLFVDVYYTLYTRHGKKTKSKDGFGTFPHPLIYSWLAYHLYMDISMIKTMNNHDWS